MELIDNMHSTYIFLKLMSKQYAFIMQIYFSTITEIVQIAVHK